MPKSLLRYRDLVERNICRIKRSGFPPGKLIGPNSRAWDESEVDGWLESRPTENAARSKGGPPNS